MSQIVDTSDLSAYLDCSPTRLRQDILLQLKTFGPQTLEMFFTELWETDSKEQILEVLKDMIRIGEVVMHRCPCGDWYYLQGSRPLC